MFPKLPFNEETIGPFMPEKISCGLHEERTRRINGTKSILTAAVSLSHGLSWPRGFGLCLSKPRLTLDVKVLYKWTKTLSAACWNHKRLQCIRCFVTVQTFFCSCSRPFNESEKWRAGVALTSSLLAEPNANLDSAFN